MCVFAYINIHKFDCSISVSLIRYHIANAAQVGLARTINLYVCTVYIRYSVHTVQCTYGTYIHCTYGVHMVVYIQCTHGTVYIWYSVHTYVHMVQCTYVRVHTYGVHTVQCTYGTVHIQYTYGVHTL